MALDEKQIEKLTTRVIDALHTVYDPEIPVDVYELGLIYDISITPEGKTHILMTMTTPNCPMIESLPEEIKEKVGALTDVSEVDIEVTFEPSWDKDMMSEEAKLQLGFL
ncbi:MAG: iron-sulfur cluster assembly protein [Flavobacteriales bacterium]|nr:iron-sulfur cluster assembly protein [Flavobacteriales bacterium]